MSLSNFIKNILNIQDNNISFPEEDYSQTIKNDNYLIKVFKAFLKADYCSCFHCNSQNIVKNDDIENVILSLLHFKVTILRLFLVLKDIVKIVKNSFSPFTNIVDNNFIKKKI